MQMFLRKLFEGLKKCLKGLKPKHFKPFKLKKLLTTFA